MELSEALISIPQKERGGEVAIRGFDFQTCWAISHMLEYEMEGKEYVFIFEYHDDVLIIDSEDKPESIIFAQVKTSENHWTLGRLINRSSKKPVSFVGKLFKNKKNFSEFKSSLIFVTNAYFSFESKDKFLASELTLKDQQSIKKELEMQLGKGEVIDLTSLKFLRSSLSLEDHSSHLKGKICDFFEMHFKGDVSINPIAFAKTLEIACRNKSKMKSSDIKSFDELVKKKGFSSSYIKNSLDRLYYNSKTEPKWEDARDIFQSCGKRAVELISLRSAFSRIAFNVKKDDVPERFYLEKANLLFDSSKVEGQILDYIEDVKSILTQEAQEYSLALKNVEKECIIVYSIIKNLLEGE